PGKSASHELSFRSELALDRQPRANLFALYGGWMEAIVGLLVARHIGVFVLSETSAQAAARLESLREYARLILAITQLRSAASKERQVPRQVELNLRIRLLERQLSAAKERLLWRKTQDQQRAL